MYADKIPPDRIAKRTLNTTSILLRHHFRAAMRAYRYLHDPGDCILETIGSYYGGNEANMS